ncbi:MAG: hypothetical protein LBS24_08010 [Clostridiales Family XIII bacterium]|jgi:hypothetical protein|nr:hypothetical protein [Clostridiales Family XIII bacterium]
MKTKYAPRAPDPFDASAGARLVRMGLADENGEISGAAVSVLAGVFAGLFCEDVCDCCGSQAAQELCGDFEKICENGDRGRAYLFLSLCYDRMRKPLPDPVWQLAGNPAAVAAFMKYFTEKLACLVERTDHEENKMKEA